MEDVSSIRGLYERGRSRTAWAAALSSKADFSSMRAAEMVLSRLLLGEWVKVGRRSRMGDLGLVAGAELELELELVRERPRGLDGRPWSLLMPLVKAGSVETLTGKRKVDVLRRWVGLDEASGDLGGESAPDEAEWLERRLEDVLLSGSVKDLLGGGGGSFFGDSVLELMDEAELLLESGPAEVFVVLVLDDAVVEEDNSSCDCVRPRKKGLMEFILLEDRLEARPLSCSYAFWKI